MGGSFKMENVSGNNAGIGNGAKGTISINQASTPQLAEIERKLQELTALVTQHASEIVDRAEVQDAITKVGRELQSDGPRLGKVQKWLGAVSAAAPGVSAIAQSVKAITDALPGR